MTGPRTLVRLGVLAGLAIAGQPAARAETAIAIVAPARCPPELRERIAEQIAGEADGVTWSCLSRFDGEEPFRNAAAGRGELEFWIDLTHGPEARIMLRDARSDRFVVRRVPLPDGLDEIGREEIGQIVRAASLAVRAGPEDTLTRAEARAEVARWPQPPAPPPPAPARRRPPPSLNIDVEAFAAARALASPVPVVAELGLGGDLGRLGPLEGWVEASYQLPARYQGTPVSVALSAFAVRAGIQAVGHLSARWEGRLGAGGGATRMSFTPRSQGTAATAAAPGAFWYATGRALAGVDARLAAHLVVGLTAFLDVVGADVHYDLRQPDGTSSRVMAPYRFEPGLAVGIASRFD